MRTTVTESLLNRFKPSGCTDVKIRKASAGRMIVIWFNGAPKECSKRITEDADAILSRFGMKHGNDIRVCFPVWPASRDTF